MKMIFKKNQKVDSLLIEAPVVNSEKLSAWCSWCGEYGDHTKIVPRLFGRSTYKCESCQQPTIQCRYCESMAKAANPDSKDGGTGSNNGIVSGFFVRQWNNEFCSEHDGTTPDFTKTKTKIKDFSKFSELMVPRKANLYQITKNTVIIGGALLTTGGAAYAYRQGIAGALGRAGLLGKASTGKPIKVLTGAALQKAAVAKLGTVGLSAITLIGSTFGGKTGYDIASAYLKDIPDFNFVQIRKPSGDSNHCTIVINGLMSEQDAKKYKNSDMHWETITKDWLDGLPSNFEDVWHLNWEAKTLIKMADWTTSFRSSFLGKGAAGLVGSASKKAASGVNAATMGYTLTKYLSNPWHSAMVNAEKTGIILAEAISRVEGKTFTLMGHSLGARVIAFAMAALAAKGNSSVKNVVLLGGAVGKDDQKFWNDIGKGVSGHVYNCYSKKDSVLSLLYRGANAGVSSPAGLGVAAPPAQNLDCTDIVSGHLKWKDHLSEILTRLSISDS